MIPPNAVASRIKRGNWLRSPTKDLLTAKIFDGSEKFFIKFFSNPPTLTSFEAPKASITVLYSKWF